MTIKKKKTFRKDQNERDLVIFLNHIASYNTRVDALRAAIFNSLTRTVSGEKLLKKALRKKLIRYQVYSKDFVILTRAGYDLVYKYRLGEKGVPHYEGVFSVSSHRRIPFSKIRAVEQDFRRVIEKHGLNLGMSFTPDVSLRCVCVESDDE